MSEAEKVVPHLCAELMAQARLNFLPGRQSAIELGFSGFCQVEPAFSTVFATALSDPSPAADDFQGASQSGAVDGENFAQLSLRQLSSKRECLKNGELGTPQPKRTEGIVVKLGERPGCAAEVATHAGEQW